MTRKTTYQLETAKTENINVKYATNGFIPKNYKWITLRLGQKAVGLFYQMRKFYAPRVTGKNQIFDLHTNTLLLARPNKSGYIYSYNKLFGISLSVEKSSDL